MENLVFTSEAKHEHYEYTYRKKRGEIMTKQGLKRLQEQRLIIQTSNVNDQEDSKKKSQGNIKMKQLKKGILVSIRGKRVKQRTPEKSRTKVME